MNSAREQQIRALVRAALERPPEQRASFVAELAGADDELRRSVETQLSQQNATDVGAREKSAEVREAAEFPAGAQLGHYRIDGVLGRGGMGVVYRATDTRLGRSVAIKFLSAAVADAEVTRRFRQEAKTASSLNHPHIVTVHDVGEHDGRQYIVSELVDGGTLDDWALAAKRRGWRQSVELVIGVADALAAAHSAGVLHRDVKPGNILIGSNGYAKLADFGLAKLVGSSGNSQRGSGGKPPHTTRAGLVVGTVAYMSPEQAAGHPVDARSDVFSFGIVLYELLAGRRPFDAANDLEVLKAIAHATPKPLSDDVPEFLRHVVDKALEKEPADRYQSMQDLVVDLKRVTRKATSSTATSASDVRVVAGVVKRHPVVVLGAAVAVVLAAVGATYFAMSRLAPAGSSATAASTRGFEITPLTTSGTAAWPAISPDGKYVAYVQRRTGDQPSRLWIRQIATPTNAPIVTTEAGVEVSGPTITPDGSFVLFLRRGSGQTTWSLWRVPFLGGGPEPLIEDVGSPVGVSPDGRRIAFVRATPSRDLSSALVVADAEGGGERVLATRKGGGSTFSYVRLSFEPYARPAWSPDGHLIALFEVDLRTLGSHVVVVDVATGRDTILDARGVRGAQGLAWLDDASLVLSQSKTRNQRLQLWRMSYPDGAVSPMTNDLSSLEGVDLNASRETLVTSRRERRISIWVGDAHGGGAAMIVPWTPYGSRLARLSWAGERLLYDGMVNGRAYVMAVAAAGGAPEEIIPNAFAAAATRDVVVFMADDHTGLWKLSAPSRRPVELVAGENGFRPFVTPDGRSVVFISTRDGTESPWIVPIDGGEPKLIVDAYATAVGLDVAPDNRRLVFLSRDANNEPIFVVCDLPDCANRRDLPARSFIDQGSLRWTPGGQEVAYVEAGGKNIWATPLDGGAPHAITEFADDGSDGDVANFAWSGDGRRLAIVRMTTTNDIVLLRLKPEVQAAPGTAR